MTHETLIHIQDYLRQKRFTEARELLQAQRDNARAQAMLAQLEAYLATLPPQIMQAERALLAQRFDEARALLMPIAGHPLAKVLLARAEALQLEYALPEPLPAEWELKPAATSVEAPIQSLALAFYGRLNENGIYARVAGSCVIFCALLMIIGFIGLPWIDSGATLFLSTDGVPVRLTAYEIWSGSGRGPLGTLDLEKQSRREKGFGAVRLVDRTLMVIPIGAAGLIMLTVRYMAHPAGRVRPLLVMSVVAFSLFAFPYVWEHFSTANWRHYAATLPPERLFGPNGAGLRTTFGAEALAALFGDFLGYLLYNTDPQKVLGAAAFALCLFTWGSAFVNHRQKLL